MQDPIVTYLHKQRMELDTIRREEPLWIAVLAFFVFLGCVVMVCVVGFLLIAE